MQKRRDSIFLVAGGGVTSRGAERGEAPQGYPYARSSMSA